MCYKTDHAEKIIGVELWLESPSEWSVFWSIVALVVAMVTNSDMSSMVVQLQLNCNLITTQRIPEEKRQNKTQNINS